MIDHRQSKEKLLQCKRSSGSLYFGYSPATVQRGTVRRLAGMPRFHVPASTTVGTRVAEVRFGPVLWGFC